MKQECPSIDIEFAKCCIEADIKNSVTSHYYLLIKKKEILQESLSDLSVEKKEQPNLIPIPGGKQVRDHHSIPAAPRHNIGNLDRMKNQQADYQMKKMQGGGLNQINLQNQN